MGHAVAREPVGGAGWRGDGTIVNLHSHRPQSLRRLLLPWALLAAVLLYASSSADPVEAAGPLAAGDQAVISADGDGLNLRQTPALDGVILAFAVPDGTVVTARGAQYMADGICWEAVTHDGQPGWMAAEYLVPVGGEADDDADPCADAERVDEPSVLPAPPPGGWTQGVAGTSDIEALVAAQTFDVQSVWALDLATQDFQSYIPGAPAFVNNPGVSSLRPDSVVMMLRRGERPDELPGAPVAEDEAPRGVANVLPTPPDGGFTLGVSGTNDAAVLAALQPFEVHLIAMLDVPSQTWLTYIPGAPPFVQSLTRGRLQPDSTVWVRAGAVPEPEPTATPEPEPTATPEPEPTATPEPEPTATPEPEPTATPEPEPTATPEPEPTATPGGTTVEARITYFYCNQGTISAGIGDGGGWCEYMANGEIVHEGAAACSRDNFRQRFRIIGDPNGLIYTCTDTGNAVHGEQRDIWFDNSDDGLNWIREVGTTALVEILPE